MQPFSPGTAQGDACYPWDQPCGDGRFRDGWDDRYEGWASTFPGCAHWEGKKVRSISCTERPAFGRPGNDWFPFPPSIPWDSLAL